MSLAVALNNARTSLLTTAKQISVSGRNIAGADDPNYTRRIGNQSTTADGSSRIVSIARAMDLGLFTRVLGSKSSAAGQQALLDGLERLHDAVGDTNSGTSPAARIAALASALQAQANAPTDRSLAQATLTAAGAVVTSLTNATAAVTSVRNEADARMVASVDRVNDLLGQLGPLNTAIVRGTHTGEDVTEALDHRDAILAELSEEVGITTVQRADNDIAVFTDSGVPLFDKIARTVTLQPSASLVPGTTGNAVVIDGVPVTGANATMALRAGRLTGLAALRDTVAPAYQAQLDEMARGVVEAFAEADQSGGGGADLAGLFTYGGGPAIPPAAALVDGLALTLQVNPAVDPAQGGSLDRLRDGGINGVAYSYNTTAAASFSDRLEGLIAEIGAARGFDSDAGLQSGVSVLDFGTASVAWLEDLRQATTIDVEYQNTVLAHTTDALSNASGVNIDEEYAKQLQLEQSYAASSKLIGIIDQLFKTLLEAVG